MNSNEEVHARVAAWLADARAHPQIAEPGAMTLATVDGSGKPSARIVLLKAHDARGFTFFTNNESRKGGELWKNSHAALCFYWMKLYRQLRVEGIAQPVSASDSDAYFASRARESQIGAWASAQSRPLESREELLQRFNDYKAKFSGNPVPRPPYWGGWRILPHSIEFWEEAPHRLHTRELFIRKGEGWEKTLLCP